VREALLTIALEATQRKGRILETYLNVAEWGPGIVGLGEAARHYFDKAAVELTPREAAFLATLLPNPVRFHMYCARGATSPAWDARIDALLERLHATGVLSDAELEAALAEPLAFAHGGRGRVASAPAP
jgi:membrane peptidoglycan carboxypeptidase